MVQFIIFILIVMLISMILFDLTGGIFKYIALGIFTALFGIILLNSNFYLDLPTAGSITFIYFIFIIFQAIIPLRFSCYIIIGLTSLSFILHLIGYSPFAQNLVNLAFYSIIILVIRLTIKLDNKT